MEISATDPDRPPRPRIRVRLSVRTLMVAVMAIALGLGWYVRAVRTQREAVAVIAKAGGSAAYDWEWGNYNPNIISYNGKRRAPKWVADRLGIDYVGSVVHASLVPGRRGTRADDSTLASVAHLGRARSRVGRPVASDR